MINTMIRNGKEHPQYAHGMYGTPLYKKWSGMKRRCLNKNDKSYKNYGGRGITVCEKWMNFKGFMEDMGTSFKEGLSIERIDNEKGYSKKNCKWITMEDQARNKRGLRIYTHDGKKMSIAEWERERGFKDGTLRARLDVYGWSFEKAISTPKTKYPGVSYISSRNRWQVELTRKGKRYFVGRYKTKTEAIRERRNFIKKLKI